MEQSWEDVALGRASGEQHGAVCREGKGGEALAGCAVASSTPIRRQPPARYISPALDCALHPHCEPETLLKHLGISTPNKDSCTGM